MVKDIISIKDFSRKDLEHLFGVAKEMETPEDGGKSDLYSDLLHGKIMASLFFEPSTRTRLSFEAAMHKLGGDVIGFADKTITSIEKGEGFKDTIKTIENYADIFVIRHNKDGAARLAGDITDKPVINAGDGTNQHPTQTLLDLYTIKKTQNSLDGLKIAMVGDLKNGRTVHSLTYSLLNFEGNQLYFVSPPQLKMPSHLIEELNSKKCIYTELDKLESVLNEVDIIYMTRIQKERFDDELEYRKVKGAYILNASMLNRPKSNLKIMHPMPIDNEIDYSIDETKHACYFEQVKNSIPVRKACLVEAFGMEDLFKHGQ